MLFFDNREKNKFVELMTSTLIAVAERRDGEKKEDKYDEIRNFYENILNNSDHQYNIASSIIFMDMHLEKGEKIYFLNKKAYLNKSYTGLFQEDMFINGFSMQIDRNKEFLGIMGIDRDALYELGIKDEQIMEVDKNTPREAVMEAFAYNNLFLFPQKVLSYKAMFENNSSEKYERFWDLTIELNTFNFENNVKKLKNESRYETMELISPREINNICLFNESMREQNKDNDLYNIRYFLDGIFSKNKINRELDRDLKSIEYRSVRAGFPTITDQLKASAYLIKDFIKDLYNENEKTNSTLFLLTAYLFKNKDSEINVSNNLKNIIDFLNTENDSPNILIKKAIIYYLLDQVQEKISYFGAIYEVDTTILIKAMPYIKENEKYVKVGRYIEGLNAIKYNNKKDDEINSKYYLAGNTTFLLELGTTTLITKMLKKIMEDISKRKDMSFVLSINEQNYILEYDKEVNKESFENALKETVKKLLNLNMVLKRGDAEQEEQKSIKEEINNIFINNEIMKRTREIKLTGMLTETKESLPKKKL